jgi:hypothetical protein
MFQSEAQIYFGYTNPACTLFPTLVPTEPALVATARLKWPASHAVCVFHIKLQQNILKTSHEGAIMAIHQALLLHADCIASFWTGSSGEYKHISLEGSSSSIKLGQNSKQAPFDMTLYAFYLLVSFLHPLTWSELKTSSF